MTWTRVAHDLGPSSAVYGPVVYAESLSRFVGLVAHVDDHGGRVVSTLFSTDGVTWERHQNNLPDHSVSRGPPVDLLWIDSLSRFVLITFDDGLWYSDDGLTWSEATVPCPTHNGFPICGSENPAPIYDIEWSPELSRLVLTTSAAQGELDETLTPLDIYHCYPVRYSDDGIVWHMPRPVPSYYVRRPPLHFQSCGANGVEWIDSLSVFLIDMHRYSRDGETWTHFEGLVDALEIHRIRGGAWHGEWSDELSRMVLRVPYPTGQAIGSVSGIPELFRRVAEIDP